MAGQIATKQCRDESSLIPALFVLIYFKPPFLEGWNYSLGREDLCNVFLYFR